MASVIAIGSEVIGECVEGIRIEVGRRNIEDGFGVHWIFRFCAQGLDGSVMRQWCQVLEADLLAYGCG